jgi:hypothetical protein
MGWMLRSIGRIGAVALAMASGVLLLALPDAIAKKGPRRNPVVGVSARANLGTAPVTLEPQCPTRTKAIGGGFSAFTVTTQTFPDPPIVASVTMVYESHRAGPRAWRTSAVKLKNPAGGPFAPPPGSFDLEAWSYCKRIHGKIKELAVTGPATSSSDAASTATATCPRRSSLLAGGYSASPVPGPGFAYPAIFENFPSGRRSWTASAVPLSQPSVQVTSVADCIRASKKGSKGSKGPVLRTGGLQSNAAETSECPGKLRAGDGGFRFPRTISGPAGFSEAGPGDGVGIQDPGVVYPIGQTWIVFGGSGTTAFALCG